MDKRFIIVGIQIVLIFTIVIIVTLFIQLNNAIKLEKRISRYSVRYDNSRDNTSMFDKVLKKYLSFIKKQRKKIRKLFPTLVKRYEKYVASDNIKAADYVTNKIFISCLFVLLTIIANIIQSKLVTIWQLLFSMAFGFFILDLVLIIQRKFNKKKIENEMLRAIIIMNNAFKSGKSTIQAVEIASRKLPNPVGYEFKKIYEEMQYGMSVDTVFDRFSKRVNIEEAEYLSSSLTILNRTGGNIVAVFDSIEKTLFDKKKLKEELKNTTTVSKLVVRIMLIVPLVFILLIYLFDPNYFDPFFESTLGYIFVAIAFILFIIYAYLLDRIVRVDY